MSVLINASTSTGLVQSADTSGEIELQSNGTTALKVNTNEGIQILNCLGVGNATPSTSGAGITFPATQSASTDANTLDDYEEGTWTPSVGGNATYSVQNGTYTKIGNLVWARVRFTITTLGTGSTTLVSGLPFTSSSVPGGQGCPIAYFENMAVNVIAPVFHLAQNTTQLNVNGRASAGASMTENLAVFGNGTRVDGTIIYTVS